MYLLERMTWQVSAKSLEHLKTCTITIKAYKCLSFLHSLGRKHGSTELRTLIRGRRFILEWQCHQTGVIPRTVVSAVEGIFTSSSWLGESYFSMWEFGAWLWLVLRVSPAPLLFLSWANLAASASSPGSDQPRPCLWPGLMRTTGRVMSVWCRSCLHTNVHILDSRDKECSGREFAN